MYARRTTSIMQWRSLAVVYQHTQVHVYPGIYRLITHNHVQPQMHFPSLMIGKGRPRAFNVLWYSKYNNIIIIIIANVV